MRRMAQGKQHGADATTGYFTGLAQGYDAHRPSYPREAIEAIVNRLARPMVIVDVGCGTGISTRLLTRAAGSGSHVIGIDPNADMLHIALQAAGGPNDTTIDYRPARAEATGLGAGSADAVVCAQAFHWFDARAALREFHRVLKSSGRLAVMWNVKDRRTAFSAGFCDLAERAMADAASRGLVVPPERGTDAALGGYFANLRQFTFDNPQPLTLAGVLGRARSASYFPRIGPLREELESALQRLFDTHQRDGEVMLWHRTELTLADRAP